MKKVILALLLLISIVNRSFAQIDYTQKDLDIYAQCMQKLTERKGLPINELAVLTASYFIDTPYVAATLEKNDEEQLVVNLREFDCTTFVENVIALTKEIKKGQNPSFSGYVNTLKNMRYRGGVVDGYASRIHYTSEWVGQNTNLFRNVSLELGGAVVNKPLSFMTSNAHLYPKLKGNGANISALTKIEASLNNKGNYVVIAKDKIEEAADKIQDGDIILFATRVSGLDYSHVGFAFWEDDILKLLHASSVEKKVTVDKKNLIEYCQDSRSCTGITVLRLID